MWTLIDQAKRRDSEALERIARKYRPPIVQFALNRGLQEADAEDAAQEVFARVFQPHVLHAADASKGRFRSLLLAITKHVITELRRGAAKSGVSLDQPRYNTTSEGALGALVATEQQDQEFDRLWALNLIRLSMELLKKESEEKGTPYYEAFVLAVRDQLSYAEIGSRLGKTEKEVGNYVFRAKGKLREYFARCIEEYSSSEDEFRHEQDYLAQFFDHQPSA